jgi:hypothetical protein
LILPPYHPADQSPAADGHQQRVELWGLLLQLEADGALPQQRLDLLKSMDRQRAAPRLVLLASGQRIGMAPACHHEPRATVTNRRDLGGRRDGWYVDRRRDAQPPCRKCDRHTMIATRGRDDPRRWHLAQQEIGERATCFKRARELQQVQLEHQRRGHQSEVRGIQGYDRSAPNVGRNPLVRGRYALRGYERD